MQLTIDTHSETSRALRLYAGILQQLAQLALDEIADVGSPQIPFHYSKGELAGIARTEIAAPPAPPPPPVTDAYLQALQDRSNVVPFVPGVATAPTTALSVASVAAVAPAAPSVASAPVGCDSTGLPWDERIHSSGENKLNSDGTWRQKRGANPMLVASVTAELRARPPQAAVSPPPPPAAAGTATQVLPLPVPPPPAAVSVQPSDTGLPAPVLPVLPPPAVGTVPAAVTFTQLFAAANRHGFDNDRLTALVVKAGGTGLESLVNNPGLIAIVHQMVQESAGAQ